MNLTSDESCLVSCCKQFFTARNFAFHSNLGEIPEQNRARILAIGNFELFPGENLTVTRLGVNIP